MITTKITVLCLLLFQCHSFHMISDFSIKNMIIAQNNITYCEIYDYMRNESIKTFSDYYELDDFKISNYAEQIKQNHIEVILDYTIFYHNIEKILIMLLIYKKQKSKMILVINHYIKNT